MVEGEVNRSIPRLGTPQEEPLLKSQTKKNPPPSPRMHLPDTACQPQPRISPRCREKSSAGANVCLPRPAQMRSRVRGRKPDVRIHRKKSALFSTKWCTTMAAVPQIRAGGGAREGDPMGTQLPGRQKHRHGKKGAGTGRADYFKDGIWAGGSKRARLDTMWNLQQDLSSLAEQMEIRFFITAEKISDN